ncbi:YeiH family protein [Roseibium sp. FZY0029]|uniref:YeiH family protein n=1 Tax=Roseibium sp. FZY0029 TaxID=3116647 RepID=UPI002ECDA78F|nr:YeiH family protein [Roseibium sp. FZY0029]
MKTEASFSRASLTRVQSLAPGVLICALIALAAQFLSEHYGSPAMLMALLLGMTMNFVQEEPSRAAAGVGFSAKVILRIAVALLGARIGFDAFVDLGWPVVLLVVSGLLATLVFGYAVARLLGRGWRLAILTAGAVSICGASAAMAIAAVLPKNEFSERNLGFTVFSVTLLSTLAMIGYPLLASVLNFDQMQSGIFLGATIHDVAQVVGAGFGVSDATGETATTVKLIRVSMLAPFVLLLTLALRGAHETSDGQAKRPPLIPGFVLAFLLLVIANSFGLLPAAVQSAAVFLSKWAMLTAIAAVGVKTELRKFREIPPQSVALIVLETGFIACFAITWLKLS